MKGRETGFCINIIKKVFRWLRKRAIYKIINMTKEAINSNLNCAGLEAALQMEDRNQMMIAYTYRMDQGKSKLDEKVEA